MKVRTASFVGDDVRSIVMVLLLATGCAGSSAVRPPAMPPPLDRAPTRTVDPNESGSISGMVRHVELEIPLGNALVVLQSSEKSAEMLTDVHGRFSFDGLPPGTYSVQVLVGQADIRKVLTLPREASFRANFRVNPDEPLVVCTLPGARPGLDESMFSVRSHEEARLLGIPRTVYK